MTIKRKKKGIGKFRGSRNCGKGNVKNRGKPSSKGGRGQAGLKNTGKPGLLNMIQIILEDMDLPACTKEERN